MRLSRCLERRSVYLLLVAWDRLEDHAEGFRGSAGYREWRRLLHPFYDPFPTLGHFEDVLGADLDRRNGHLGNRRTGAC